MKQEGRILKKKYISWLIQVFLWKVKSIIPTIVKYDLKNI